MEETGLDSTDKKVAFLSYQNRWDKKSRLIHRIPGVKVTKSGEGCDRKKKWNEQPFWPDYWSKIAWILFRYPNERCFISAGSYELTICLGEELQSVFEDRIIIDRGGDHAISDLDSPDEIEMKMKKNPYLFRYLSTPASVLISPRLGRGTDLAYGACRNFILAKVPFADLGDRRIAARVNNTRTGGLYYMVNSMRDSVQNFGRGHRAEDDWVRNWVVDDCFQQIVDMRGLIPRYISEAIRPPNDFCSKYKPLEEPEK